MSFTSIAFLAFMSITFIIYYSLPLRFRYIALLAASALFIWLISPKTLFVLGGFILLSYVLGRLLEQNKKKIVLLVSLVASGSVLLIYYFFDFVSLGKRVFETLGLESVFPYFAFALPVGASFWTLKMVGYLIDIYKGRIKAERNILKYALYVSFFAQVTSGPIVKAQDFLAQISEERAAFSYVMVKRGILLMAIGTAMKLVVANRLAAFVDTVYYGLEGYYGFVLLFAAIGYSFQIYFDFSSYSLLAIGAAQVFGIETKANFQQPYFSQSIREFWRRWHISFSTWLKEYVYIPLGGNRKGKVRKYINLFLTFLVSGIWHGSGLHFLIWGGLHGVYQIASDMTANFRRRLCRLLHIDRETEGAKFGAVLVTFMLVTFAWVFFRIGTVSELKMFFVHLLTWNPWVLSDGTFLTLGQNGANLCAMIVGVAAFFVGDYFAMKKDLFAWFDKQPWVFRWTFYGILFLIILIMGVYGPGYDSQSFIYQQF